jgi:hypothetical protein
MEFLYPNMLYALFALLIPVVIHLFNFRRHKTVYFSNTSILKTIEQENKKTKKLKDLIVLITRMLFIAVLVVAFAYPYKKNNNAINNNVENLIAVYIDNSMSMQSYSSEKTLFDDARSSAVKLVENLNQAQKFVLLSNDRNPINEYPMNKDEMLIRLNEMKTESAPASFEDIYNSIEFIKKKNNFKSASLFVYSDFQKNMMKVDESKNDTTIQIVVFPLKSDFQNNIYIDSVWIQSPVLQKNLTNEINARVVNETSNDIKGLPVNFSLDGNVVAYTTVDVVANSHSDVNMQFVIESDGDKKAQVSIQDSPITFDDEYNLVLKVRPVINVVEILSSAHGSQLTAHSFLDLLFEGDALVNYQSMSPYNIDQNVINNAQMIVLDAAANVNATMQQSLLDFASQGGSLVVFNNEETDNSLLYDRLGIMPKSLDDNVSRIEYVAKQNSFFDDIFVKFPENAALPEVNKHISFDIRNNNVLNIASLQNGEPFIMMSRVDKGSVFVFSSTLDEEWCDLANHAIFVPLMYKMALVGGGVSDLSYTLGRDKYHNINNMTLLVDDRISVRSENGLYETFPLVENRGMLNYLYFFEDLPSAGFYDIYKNEDYISTMAWNDNRNESEMSFYEKDDVAKLLKDKELNLLATIDYDEINSENMMEVVVRDTALWKIFVIISLILLLIEILVLRFFK